MGLPDAGPLSAQELADQGLAKDATMQALAADVAKNEPMAQMLTSLLVVLRAVANPITVDQVAGRMRVSIEAGSVGISTNQTLTNLAQHGGVAANSLVYDQMHGAWAGTVRRCIT